MDQQHDTLSDVDDELLAMLGFRRVRVREAPAPPASSPPTPVTFEELMAEVFGPQTRTNKPVEPVPPQPDHAPDPKFEQEFAQLFGPRAREVLGQDIEPITAGDITDPMRVPGGQTSLSDASLAAPEVPSSAELPVVRQQAPEHPTPEKSMPVPAVPSAAPSRWKRTLQIGSAVAAGGLVLLGVLAVRRRFEELRRLNASEVAQVRGELKAEIGKLREYVRGNPGAAPAEHQVERADKELDDLFAEIDRRHQRRT